MKQKRDAKGRFLSNGRVYARGIKGFKKGLICEPDYKHRKQYKENTVFEEEGGSICGPGMMHAVDSSLDVLDYVSLVNSDGTVSEFAEVEALSPVRREGEKWATTKLRVGKKLSFKEFVDLYIKDIIRFIINIRNPKKEEICNFNYEAQISSSCRNSRIASSGALAQIGISGNWARIGSSGEWTQIGISGDWARIGSSGEGTQIGISGNWAQIASSGLGTHISSSGNDSRIASSGNDSRIASSGNDSQIASSGNGVQIASSGNGSWIASYGNEAQIVSSGLGSRINGSGNDAKICSTGIGTKIVSRGADAVIAAIGEDSVVAAELGSWVVAAEYNKEGKCICVKSAQVDGINLKPGVVYKLENGDFKEVK